METDVELLIEARTFPVIAQLTDPAFKESRGEGEGPERGWVGGERSRSDNRGTCLPLDGTAFSPCFQRELAKPFSKSSLQSGVELSSSVKR